MFNKEKQQELYDEEYFKSYNLRDINRISTYQNELKRIEHKIPLKGNVLDVGCGTGDFFKADIKGVFKYYEKYGIEISKYAAKYTKNITLVKAEELKENVFDVIIMRGVIQHLPNPLDMISICYKALKPRGKLIFLATPNTNSIYYKLWGTLPMLDPKYNFMIPSDNELCNILINFGFKINDVVYPYEFPYAHWTDKFKFVAKLFGAKVNFAWPKNMMEIIAVKPTRNSEISTPISTMSLGDIIDASYTTELKLQNHKDKETTHLLMTNLQMQYMLINKLEMREMSFISFPKCKVYDNNLSISVSDYEEAKIKLKEVVTKLWNHQEFVNLKKYQTATPEELLDYITKLDSLNRERNYLIDNINTYFDGTRSL